MLAPELRDMAQRAAEAAPMGAAAGSVGLPRQSASHLGSVS